MSAIFRPAPAQYSIIGRRQRLCFSAWLKNRAFRYLRGLRVAEENRAFSGIRLEGNFRKGLLDVRGLLDVEKILTILSTVIEREEYRENIRKIGDKIVSGVTRRVAAPRSRQRQKIITERPMNLDDPFSFGIQTRFRALAEEPQLYKFSQLEQVLRQYPQPSVYLERESTWRQSVLPIWNSKIQNSHLKVSKLTHPSPSSLRIFPTIPSAPYSLKPAEHLLNQTRARQVGQAGTFISQLLMQLEDVIRVWQASAQRLMAEDIVSVIAPTNIIISGPNKLKGYLNKPQNAIQAAWESKLLPVSGLLTSGAQCSRDFRSTTQTSKQKYKLSKLAYSKSLMFDFTWYYHDFTIITWVFRRVAGIWKASAAAASVMEDAAGETDVEEEYGGYADKEEEKGDDSGHDDGLEEEEGEELRVWFGRRWPGSGSGVGMVAVDVVRHLDLEVFGVEEQGMGTPIRPRGTLALSGSPQGAHDTLTYSTRMTLSLIRMRCPYHWPARLFGCLEAPWDARHQHWRRLWESLLSQRRRCPHLPGDEGYFEWREAMERRQLESERQMQALLQETTRLREENAVLRIQASSSGPSRDLI
uniref:Uncharacterized protein n=1 Tax=Vitis vinifera TaxID=29760 RepID=A5B6U9_VITVI|nr:hypothetical protein VITISV_042318 [Vitis vinifera]